MSKRIVVGCMSGTSLDGIDSALVRIEGRGLKMRAEYLRGVSRPLGHLGKLMRPISEQAARPIGEMARYAAMLGLSHVSAIRELLRDEKADLIAVHGQTLFHEPPNSIQLMNPHYIANAFHSPVAFDFRGADLAAGGQGAPITPLADHILFQDERETRVVVNLGGFANYTWLPPTKRQDESSLESIRGGDICTCNQLLDYVARRWLKQDYDEGGQKAAVGIIHPEAEEFLAMMLRAQGGSRRSLGTGDEAIDWARTFQLHCSGEDLAATACHVIGQKIAQTTGSADRLILAGGGCENATLVGSIRAHTKSRIDTSESLGIPRQYREAVCMAVLGALAQDGVSITLPQVTGRDPDVKVMPCWVMP